MLALLCLAQALVFNHIHLFGCATPLLYVYMILVFPRSMARWEVMLWGFFMGMVIDIFSNTPGVASASLTALAAVQPYFFGLFVQHDTPDEARPSAAVIGYGKYVFYVFVLLLGYSILFYALETFHFFNWQYWLARVVGSTLITSIIVLTFESVRKK